MDGLRVGDWVIGDELGSGGCGSVFKAVNANTSQEVRFFFFFSCLSMAPFLLLLSPISFPHPFMNSLVGSHFFAVCSQNHRHWSTGCQGDDETQANPKQDRTRDQHLAFS